MPTPEIDLGHGVHAEILGNGRVIRLTGDTADDPIDLSRPQFAKLAEFVAANPEHKP